MSLGFVGHKIGMTRVFTDDGVSIPVTVVQMTAHYITQILTPENQGYSAVQMTSGAVKQSKVQKSRAGVFTKASVPAGKFLFEDRLDSTDGYAVGQNIPLNEVFFAGQFVDVTGTSKGKGFQGGVKRHNFRMQDATHGNSLSHRAPGSIGQCQTPGRVFPGKKMAGHMGDRRCTVQNQKVIRVDLEKNILLISGAIPGAPSGKVIVRASIKKIHKNEAAKAGSQS
jgi:large subunit ribosomal protein L3